MFNQIYKIIKKYDTVVIARHIGVDPDAMASQIGLANSIRLTFPDKKVFAVGSGSIKFNYIGKLDKFVESEENGKVLLIVLDTPDNRRVDIEKSIKYDYSMKIDHHPFIEKFCDFEYIDANASSVAEIIYNLLENTKLINNVDISETIYYGIVADTNRFMFSNSKSSTFKSASEMIEKYKIDIVKCYNNLYSRPIKEMKLLGYLAQNMLITDNNVGYIKLDAPTIKKLGIDSASPGNLVNEFNNIEELLVWLTASEDKKNNCIRCSVRSKGPSINKILEKYNGGGHKLASGARIESFEKVDELINDLDLACKKYKEECGINENI